MNIVMVCHASRCLRSRSRTRLLPPTSVFTCPQATRAQWCGKKVVVKGPNGNQIFAPDGGDFFIWDGCQVSGGEKWCQARAEGTERGGNSSVQA